MADSTENRDKSPKNSVTLTITDNGNAQTEDSRFHTPTLLARVKRVSDTATVKVTAKDENGERTLLEGTTKEAIAALEKSIVPADALGTELRKFAQFLLDHSSLKAIGIHAICTDAEDKDAGFGFAATAEDCTAAQAVALVNCGDANMDEFIARAKIEVPGRNGAPAKGTVVAPTPEQVEKLG